MNPTIRHALKTGLAGGLTWIICDASPLEDRTHHVWAVISAVLVMQSNLGSVLKAVGSRAVGTAFGAVFGAFVASLLGSGVGPLALGVGLTIGVCTALNLQESNRLAGSTAAVVMLTTSQELGPWGLATVRFLDVMFGMTIAILVQSLIWPALARTDLRDTLAKFLAQIRELYPLTGSVVEGICQGAPRPATPLTDVQLELMRTDLVATNMALRTLFGDLQREPGNHRDEVALWTAILHQCDELEHHVEGLIHAQESLRNDTFPRHMEHPLRDLIVLTLSLLDGLTGQLHGVPVLTDFGDDLEAARKRADDAFDRLRHTGVTLTVPLPEVLRFCTFFNHLRAVARHLIRLRQTVITQKPTPNQPNSSANSLSGTLSLASSNAQP
ncbi:FUSC family protein [Tuwongella immobilis]|uniref:Uncharacterized protein n=1 Tax=Tuwongella immobilis TaxID=692036 RepID=A0A6C2YHB9_9BACT|nr:FUSC family protein [Tuwongella immobilis]VIP00918.1 membrane protein : Uncharacterized protein OS=Calothrix sp. PCC 7507 GN=Cal7507_1400 PE=4 SV=1: FUSC [Tuwongella immobilis]VTR97254.1 membrane protein : Uncharacterized protein OS=Calothrix sp. PCC 7507 GN=Cal7507_1400 PE=4 SV=1: FUSC [Tuwongella immobilis]